MNVLIGPSSFGQTDPAPLNLLAEAGLRISLNPFGRKLTKAQVLALLPGSVGLIAGPECVDREVLSTSGLQVVSRCGSGISNVDLDAAKELGVSVYFTPEGPTQAVAITLFSHLMSDPTLAKDVCAWKWKRPATFSKD